jgi:hypothetical protein
MTEWRARLHQLRIEAGAGRHPDLFANGRPTRIGTALLQAGNNGPGIVVHRYRGMRPNREAGPEPTVHDYPAPVLRTLAMLVDTLGLQLSPDLVPRHVDAARHVVREVLVNAVVHRDYDSDAPIAIHHFTDAIEVHSPGPPPCALGEEGFAEHSARNPALHAHLHRLGLARAAGRGWAQAWAQGAAVGIDLAVEADANTVVTLTLDARKQAELDVNGPAQPKGRRPHTEWEERVLHALSDETWRRPKELEAMLGIPRSTLNRALKELEKRDEIERSSSRRNSPTQSYRRR